MWLLPLFLVSPIYDFDTAAATFRTLAWSLLFLVPPFPTSWRFQSGWSPSFHQWRPIDPPFTIVSLILCGTLSSVYCDDNCLIIYMIIYMIIYLTYLRQWSWIDSPVILGPKPPGLVFGGLWWQVVGKFDELTKISWFSWRLRSTTLNILHTLLWVSCTIDWDWDMIKGSLEV